MIKTFTVLFLFLSTLAFGQTTFIDYQLASDTAGGVYIVRVIQTITKVPSKAEGLKMILAMRQDVSRWNAQLDNISAEFLKPEEPKIKKQ